jgi:nicotinamidase-related amidase
MGLVSAENSFLLVIDLQPKFGINIKDFDAVVKTTRYLASVAAILGVPTIYTEQYPERMGGTDPSLLEVLEPAGARKYGKMQFSSFGDDVIRKEIMNLHKSQVVICGMETHICVLQTAIQLHEAGYEVFVCEDAVASFSEERRSNAIARMMHEGVHIAHSESVVYEWMRNAGNPHFKEVLQLVKLHQSSSSTATNRQINAKILR